MRRHVVALVLFSSSAAVAQPAGAQAETLFRQGRDLLRAGKTAEACGAFEESQKLEPAVTTLLNLAACREKNGQLASAWGLFLDAERQTRSATSANERQLHDVAQQHATNLEPRVSKLEVDVPDASKLDGLEIKRGDQRIEGAMWNRALPIDGGTYTITASAPGSQPWSTQLTIANEQDTKKLEIPKLVAAPHQPQQPTPPTVTGAPAVHDTVPSPSHTMPIVIGAGAVALLGASLAFDLWGDSTYDNAKAEMMSQSRRDSLYDSANTKRYAAIGLGIGGVAAGGVAVWMFLRARNGGAPSSERAVHFVPTPSGVAIAGSY